MKDSSKQETEKSGSNPLANWLLFFVTCTLCMLALSSWLFWQLLHRSDSQENFGTANMQVAEIFSQAKNINQMFTPCPDPLVDMTFLPMLHNRITWATKVPLTTNSSGIRFLRNFEEKKEGTYRIVVLGDSFIAAAASPYEDGSAPQLEKLLQKAIIRNRSTFSKIEVYPVAVSGWNIFSEINFLIHNLHRIQPDLVIHAICSNDMDSGYGFILGNLRSTVYDSQGLFGPSHMSVASPSFAVRSNIKIRGLLASYLIPESRQRYRVAAHQAERLKNLLSRYFNAKYLLYVFESSMCYGIKNTFGSFLDDEEIIISPVSVATNNLLPLDGHPNREGYRYMALAIAHYLLDHKILKIDKKVLEKNGAYDSYKTLKDSDVSSTYVEKWYNIQKIPSEVHILNGIFRPEESLRTVVGGLFCNGVLSQRSTIVLKRPQNGATLQIGLILPRHPALDGGKLSIFVDGVKRTDVDMGNRESEKVELTINLENKATDQNLVEITFQGDRYFTEPYNTMIDGVFGYAPRCGRLLYAKVL